jgi:hypothetical protein
VTCLSTALTVFGFSFSAPALIAMRSASEQFARDLSAFERLVSFLAERYSRFSSWATLKSASKIVWYAPSLRTSLCTELVRMINGANGANEQESEGGHTSLRFGDYV